MGRYHTCYFCVSCHRQLSFNQKMDNLGTCPYCGNHDKGTVVDTYVESVYFKNWWDKLVEWWNK